MYRDTFKYESIFSNAAYLFASIPREMCDKRNGTRCTKRLTGCLFEVTSQQLSHTKRWWPIIGHMSQAHELKRSRESVVTRFGSPPGLGIHYLHSEEVVLTAGPSWVKLKRHDSRVHASLHSLQLVA